MGVRKYRTLEEMNSDERSLNAGDSAVISAIRELWAISEALVQPVGLCIPRGVRKYRSIEDSNADREQWETERVRRLADVHRGSR